MSEELSCSVEDFERRARSMWGVHHCLARMPRPATGSDRELLDLEQSAREVITRYTYLYDGKDLDGLMSIFHSDCRLVNPRGTYEGITAIRRNYEYLMDTMRVVFHYAPNVLVRVFPESRTAWLSSYLFSVGVIEAELFNGNCSSYAAHLVLEDGRWLIRAMRITTNVPLALPRRPDGTGAFESPPEPSEAISSRDLIGAEFLA